MAHVIHKEELYVFSLGIYYNWNVGIGYGDFFACQAMLGRNLGAIPQGR